MRALLAENTRKKKQVDEQICRFEACFQSLMQSIQLKESQLEQVVQLGQLVDDSSSDNSGRLKIHSRMCLLSFEVAACLRVLFASDAQFASSFRTHFRERFFEPEVRERLLELEQLERDSPHLGHLQVWGGDEFKKLFGFANPLRSAKAFPTDRRRLTVAKFLQRQKDSEKKRSELGDSFVQTRVWKHSLRGGSSFRESVRSASRKVTGFATHTFGFHPKNDSPNSSKPLEESSAQIGTSALVADLVANEIMVQILVSLNSETQTCAFEVFLEKYGDLKRICASHYRQHCFLKDIKDQKEAFLEALFDSKRVLKQQYLSQKQLSVETGVPNHTMKNLTVLATRKDELLMHAVLCVRNLLAAINIDRIIRLSGELIQLEDFSRRQNLYSQNLTTFKKKYEQVSLSEILEKPRFRLSCPRKATQVSLLSSLPLHRFLFGDEDACSGPDRDKTDVCTAMTSFVKQKCLCGLTYFREQVVVLMDLRSYLSENIICKGAEHRRSFRKSMKVNFDRLKALPPIILPDAPKREVKKRPEGSRMGSFRLEISRCSVVAPRYLQNSDLDNAVVANFFCIRKLGRLRPKPPTREDTEKSVLGKTATTNLRAIEGELNGQFRLLEFFQRDHLMAQKGRAVFLEGRGRRDRLNQTARDRPWRQVPPAH